MSRELVAQPEPQSISAALLSIQHPTGLFEEGTNLLQHTTSLNSMVWPRSSRIWALEGKIDFVFHHPVCFFPMSFTLKLVTNYVFTAHAFSTLLPACLLASLLLMGCMYHKAR